MEFKVRRNDVREPNSMYLSVTGENLVQAVKNNLPKILDVSSSKFIPFRYPMTITPSYGKGIIGGQGGIELKCEWMYSSHTLRPETLHTHTVWILAQESELNDTTPFVITNSI